MKDEKNNKMLNQFLEKVNNCKNDVDLSYFLWMIKNIT